MFQVIESVYDRNLCLFDNGALRMRSIANRDVKS